MRTRTISSTICFRRGRLDSNYYLAPGVEARDRLHHAQASGLRLRQVGTHSGVTGVWQPKRFKRTYAADGEDSVSYLRPYDVFEYLPMAADRLSATRTENLQAYELTSGTILQTCSGRNLGPLAVTDRYLERFVLSHDMLRIDVDNDVDRGAIWAFLSSSVGQAILRQRMSGSVVDHLTVDDLASLEIPELDETLRSQVGGIAHRSLVLVEAARLELSALVAEYESRLPDCQPEGWKRDGWTVTSSSLSDRLDAAYYDPVASNAREALLDSGGGAVGDIARALLPGRYTRYYVGKDFGKPILSGTQLLQYEPINLKYISERSFKNPEEMILEDGMVCFGADGRWEGRLGWPAYVTSDRAGWLASNHVMRLRPKEGVQSGWLWLAMATRLVQDQIVALPYGSVVDATRPEDVESVILPPVEASLGKRATRAWQRFDEARALKHQAVAKIESMLPDIALGPH